MGRGEGARAHALARDAEAQLADAVGLAAEFVGGGAGGTPAPAGGKDGPELLQRLGRAREEAGKAWAVADAASCTAFGPGAAAETAVAITAASAEAPHMNEDAIEEAVSKLRAHLVSAAESPLRTNVDALKAQRSCKTSLTGTSAWNEVATEMENTFLGGRGRGLQSWTLCAPTPSLPSESMWRKWPNSAGRSQRTCIWRQWRR